MIIWGSGNGDIDVGRVNIYPCSTCEKDRHFKLFVQYKYAHIYYLRWVTEKKYHLICEICHRGLELNTKDIEANLLKNPIPFMTRFGWTFLVGIVAIIIVAISLNSDEKNDTPPPGPMPYSANPIAETSTATQPTTEIAPLPSKPAYEKPIFAPNGEPWPVTANYVDGYEKLNTAGLSTVTIDNSENSSDVFVKLVSLNGNTAYPVRQFFIPAFGIFTANEVTAGTYDVRYRDLDSGILSRSEAFNLEEIEIDGGTKYSSYTMTLYKVRDGNLKTFNLSEAEF